MKHLSNSDDGTRSNANDGKPGWGDSRLVYVRPVRACDVMDDLVDDNGEITIDIPENTTLFSLHSADGERIALMGDRDLAFAAARQNEMTPVNVH